ncbi:DUF6665 family protein [Frigidibacter sp. ROC022]|uniref:DUF6665 family protein n=1 Tax=Frigidibacter sp. ROC022 TaxID=2971796 RepID=UPI00215A5910|nr:DUF6665 family protein [Frigidibacter sp. ROC022]MCR8724750.1 hypothetical protein [Frigidibacter sp. ROC022]
MPPSLPPHRALLLSVETGQSTLEHEMRAEQASALGHAGRRVEAALAALTDGDEARLGDAAEAVWRYFIQREACGLRDHRPVIRALGIPARVLARLGAR